MVKIVSYYTVDYAHYAKGLRSSLLRYGFDDSHVELREVKGGWNDRCNYKAQYIREKLLELQEPVVWVDADAQLVAYPVLFEHIPADFAARYKSENKVMSGTLYFNYSQPAIDLIDRWIDNQSKRWDQKTLSEVLGDVKAYKLPDSYCKKFDEKGDTVIKHYMASRTLRH